MNIVMLRGNVGQDAEIRTTNGGDKVANIRLATSEKWTDKLGEAHERTDWHTVVAWGWLADLVDERVRQGTELFVRGSIQVRAFEHQGQKRTAVEIKAIELAVIERRDSGHQAATRGGDDRQAPDAGRDDDRRAPSGSSPGRRW